MALSRMSDHIGRVLSGRYRLIAPIGSGASAQVFLADDTRLRRRVALKLLHAALADDDAFLRRFRAEAQAAAALNHPNVMAVYDWGDEEIPYLVTEYLGGGSLRGMFDRGHVLTTSQALLVGLEASRGLEFAHRRGFVHRDIKPANLLYGDDSRLRIADFGLARALAEAAWTEPAGAVLGTARYASPEQARGEAVDGKGDVYSLALVLIEAVTGQVPFAADTTIATLMARVDRAVPVPDTLGPLRGVLERAGRPDPADRPDAGEFGVGLMAAAEELPRPKPLPLVGATVPMDDITVVDRDATMLPPRPDQPTVFDQEGGAPPGRDERLPRRRRRWPKVTLAVLLVLLLGAGAAFAAMQLYVPSHAVPRLTGLTEEQARALISQSHWNVERKESRQDESTPGEVLAQSPSPKTKLREGKTVTITVSLGNTLVDVPQDLVGIPFTDAATRLDTLGLVAGDPTRQFDENVPKDFVISLAEGTPPQIPRGDTLTLVVSDGPQPRAVPDVGQGGTFEAAAAALAAVQLQAVQVPTFHDTIPAGQVIGTDPPAGTEVPRDSPVNVLVSQGPELIPIPDVTGKSVSEATQILSNAGFVVDQVQGNPTQPVLITDPPPNEPHIRGTKVVIYTRR